MNTLVIDIECTIFQKGNPYSQRNQLVAIGLKFNDKPIHTFFEDFDLVKEYIDLADVIIGFNLKFDLTWLERIGVYNPMSSRHRFWDCQLVQFLLERQATPYPSLDGACSKHNIAGKLDFIKANYWDKGIDTTEIPSEELQAYLEQDIKATHDLYVAQQKVLPDSMKRLASVVNQDMAVLQQMESNGLYLDAQASLDEALKLQKEIDQIETEIKELLDVKSEINLASNDHLSVLLYGGAIDYDRSVQVGFFKSGKKVGQPRFKKVVYTVEYPRLVEPLKGTEYKKEGYWSTDTPTLKSLKADKRVGSVIKLLNKYSELKKLTSGYLLSWPKLIEEMDWKPDMIHGQFNQVVARTGRLSSSRPNLQNPPKAMKQFIRSRYG